MKAKTAEKSKKQKKERKGLFPKREKVLSPKSEMPIKKDVPGSVWIKRLFLMLLITGIVGMLAAFSLSSLVKSQSAPRFLTVETAKEIENVDCILVLGCGVRADGTPSAMLQDRLDVGIALYQAGVSDKLLMSGDHGRNGYDEVSAMKIYAMKQGVPSEDIFLDHEGYSTFESIYRAKEKFGAKKIVIITQEYHLHRALHIARELGLEAVGVSADLRNYRGQTRYDAREVLARFKDLFVAAKGEYEGDVGEAVDLKGNGDQT